MTNLQFNQPMRSIGTSNHQQAPHVSMCQWKRRKLENSFRHLTAICFRLSAVLPIVLLSTSSKTRVLVWPSIAECSTAFSISTLRPRPTGEDWKALRDTASSLNRKISMNACWNFKMMWKGIKNLWEDFSLRSPKRRKFPKNPKARKTLFHRTSEAEGGREEEGRAERSILSMVKCTVADDNG